MTSLVSYESSEEEEEIEETTTTNKRENSANGGHGGHDSKSQDANNLRIATSEPLLAPMVGPSLPPSMPSSLEEDGLEEEKEEEEEEEEEEDDGMEGLEGLSEQDLVRHLTQASHAVASTAALPPSPPGSPDATVESKLARFLELKHKKGLHFNADLAGKPSFKNPGFLNTMMARSGVDQSSDGHGWYYYDSSLPTEVWDPACLPRHAYKEALAQSQEKIREARKRNESSTAASGRRIEFHHASRE